MIDAFNTYVTPQQVKKQVGGEYEFNADFSSDVRCIVVSLIFIVFQSY